MISQSLFCQMALLINDKSLNALRILSDLRLLYLFHFLLDSKVALGKKLQSRQQKFPFEYISLCKKFGERFLYMSRAGI